ncbi:hypothetical protein L2E82_20020 [Cichorium intybus]|uniref:Uncharacterized protein n=1 Tax=Cichorium intybus TaxID=13427 RepID=A0ACB9DRS7_CICIN|nr:hypothetical protein L2E82_20020 [Cichorium intybus]
MEVKGKICLVLSLFVAVCLVSATVSLARSERDPVGVCKLKCEEIRGAKQDEKQECKQTCERYHQDKQRREREGGQGKERGHTGGGSGAGSGQYNIVFADIERELREMVGKCHQSCQGSKGEQENPECFRTCMEQYSPEQGKRRGGGGGDTRSRQMGRQSGREFGKGQQLNNPYVFEDHHFTARLESEQGSVRVLQKFTDRSELFQGIGKYRVAILEAEPQTFVIPNHWDADSLLFVAKGEGTISLINTDSRQNHNIKRGDVFRVPAGISAYLINRHANEKLVLAKILHSISVPGELQTFVGVGAGNPESSFFNAFSNEILQAAFDIDRESLETLFGQQKQEQGMFKKATEEQIRAMSGKEESRTWPFGESKGPYNIYKNKPSVQNDYGNLHEVDSNDYPDLRDINVAFSLFNITQGSMAGPFYNTKTTTVFVVADGVGQFEMACPHLSEQTGGVIDTVPSYEKVSSQLRRGTVVVIPAGHPIVMEASGEQNLEVIGFGLNSDQNEWFPLAGRDNVMSQWEDEAMELTFGVPANEVQKVIQKQNKKLFFKGPVRRGRAFA